MHSPVRYRSLLAARPALAHSPAGGITVVSDPGETARIEAVMAERDAVIFPDGKPGLYHRVIARHDEPTGVAVLGRYDGKIALIRHFRHPSRAWHLEIPRGAVGADEDPGHVAHLEISEEIGGTIRSLTRLGLLHGASALMRHSVVLVYAELESIGTPELGEGIAEILLVSPAEFERMIAESAITDAFTVAAAYHARLRGLL